MLVQTNNCKQLYFRHFFHLVKFKFIFNLVMSALSAIMVKQKRKTLILHEEVEVIKH